MARIHNWSFEFKPALTRFLEVANKYGASPWADDALLRAGVICYMNLDQPEEALKHYRRIVRRFPRRNEADHAAYYIGLVYEWTGRPKKARASYNSFLKRYPGSIYVGGVKRRHLPAVEVMLELEKRK